MHTPVIHCHSHPHSDLQATNVYLREGGLVDGVLRLSAEYVTRMLSVFGLITTDLGFPAAGGSGDVGMSISGCKAHTR
jgi:hypothetical protein